MPGFDNNTMYADNVDFTGSVVVTPRVTTDGQLLIGSSVSPNIRVGTITGSAGITVTPGPGTINLSLVGGGSSIERFTVQTGTTPVVPSGGTVIVNGATVAAGTNPVRSHGTAASTMALEVQISQALAATDATKIGLSNFDSVSFAVDANGFVTMVGGGGFTWSDISGAFSAAKNHGYFITGTATGTLPASPSQGDTIKFTVTHATQFLTIQANTGQVIRIGNAASSTAGTAVSTAQGDSMTLVYHTADTTWYADNGPQGNWTLA